MTQALDVEPEHRVLEIGTGSGYQAAVLGVLANEVYTIEIVAPLADARRETLTGARLSQRRTCAPATATSAGRSTRRTTASW